MNTMEIGNSQKSHNTRGVSPFYPMTKEEFSAYRSKWQLTQKQMQELLCIRSRAKISDYEHGRQPVPPYLACICVLNEIIERCAPDEFTRLLNEVRKQEP